MTTPLWCLVFVTFLPIAYAWVAGYYKNKSFGSVDNNNPRVQSAQLEGAGARAVAAQANAWEALAMFTPAVLVAHVSGAGGGSAAAYAALVFVGARLLHGVFYVADKASLRSLSFIVGLGCCGYLFYLAGSR
jgi:uncharacterized MAPEG superfamily protein